MRQLVRLLFVAAACAALPGCLALYRTSDAYPVYGNPVNPTPAPGYAVECRTVPGIAYPLFNDFHTGCRQIIGPNGEIISVRG